MKGMKGGFCVNSTAKGIFACVCVSVPEMFMKPQYYLLKLNEQVCYCIQDLSILIKFKGHFTAIFNLEV
jgi:uncharacterized protein CbrC (UPF0167 family)